MAAPACARRSSAGRSPRRFSTATLDRGQRRSQIVAERSQQRCGQLGLLPDEFRGVAVARGTARARWRSRRRRRRRRACRCPAWRAAASSPTAFVPCRSGTSVTPLLGPVLRVAAVGALMGVELERAAGPRQRVVQRRRCRAQSPRRRPGGRASPDRRQADRDRRQLEAARDVPRQHIERAGRFGRQQHVTREIEEARQLVAPRDGLARARSCAAAERLLAMTATTRNAKSAIQFCGSAIVKVPTGGRKKKLKREHCRDRHDDGDPSRADVARPAPPAAAPGRRWWHLRLVRHERAP